MKIVGGLDSTASASAQNIRTVKNANGDLEIQLAQQLTNLSSVQTSALQAGAGTLSVQSGAVSVGVNTNINMGNNRLSNVAAGTQASDAVNVTQLNSLSSVVNQGWNVSAVPGTTAQVTPGSTVNLGNGDGNIILTQTGTDIAFDLSKRITIGDVAGTPLVLDGATQTLTGLSNTSLGGADFATVGRAATEEQLTAAQTTLSSVLGGNAVNTAGHITMTDIGGTGKTTVHEAIKASVDHANRPLTLTGDSGSAVRTLDETLAVTGGATGTLTEGNIGVVTDGTDGLSIKLAEAIQLGSNGSVSMGNT